MKKNFTLAEVLISLVIIGIIAAITISNIIVGYQKKTTASQLKGAYSVISQAVEKAYVDYGYVGNWDLSLDEESFMNQYIKPYYVYTKECTSMSDGCWRTDNFDGYYDLAGNKKTNTVPYSLVLNNGMILGLNKADGESGGYNIISLIIDINGAKKPNKMGRDIFSFYIYNPDYSFASSKFKTYPGRGGVYPGGFAEGGPPHALCCSRDELLSSNVWRACNKSSKPGSGNRPGIGTACAAVIAMDSWEIKDDYPW